MTGERGSALVMVILLAVIVSAIGGTMLIMSNADHRIAANERDSERALYAARAGISYAYQLFQDGAIVPTETGVVFDSFSAAVGGPLDGAEFAGRVFDLSLTMNQGSLYRIESQGSFGTGTRTVELVFQIVPDAFKYGYMAFNEATLHNHSGYSGPSFKIQSTILSNGDVSIPQDLTIDGAIVASGTVNVAGGSTVRRGIYANEVGNSGTIDGDVRTLQSVIEMPSDAVSWDITDVYGTKYRWFNGNSSAGSFSGNPPAGGSQTMNVVDGDEFRINIFNKNGALLPSPDVNVSKYVAPPLIDYKAMRDEALLNDNTYFATSADAFAYLASKRVNETIAGKDLVTIKVGTVDAPEFLYIDGDFKVTLVDDIGDEDTSSGKLFADGISIEGGMYITGDFDYDGLDMLDPATVPPYPVPPDYYMLRINALPYCYPAILGYEEPSTGTIATWTPDDTPFVGNGSNMNMNAGGDEGPTFLNGVVYIQNDVHLHHTKDPRELIRLNGAQLAWKLHNCDFMWFSYDPAIRCTRFLTTDEGTAETVSFREIR